MNGRGRFVHWTQGSTRRPRGPDIAQPLGYDPSQPPPQAEPPRPLQLYGPLGPGQKVRRIIYPPTMSYHYDLFQRPQQLMRAFARRGWTAEYCEEMPDTHRPPRQEIEPNLFLCNSIANLDSSGEPAVLWGTHGAHVPYYYQTLRPALCVFDLIDACIEEFGQWLAYLPAAVRVAGLVTYTARTMTEGLRPFGKPLLYLPNGADVQHFARARQGMAPAAEVRAIPRPRIGFWGSMASWVDWPLIHDLARLRPNWHFLMVGPIHVPTPFDLPNVHFFGSRPYERLPEYAAAFDVGIVPFQERAMTMQACPIKLREYLAAGLPTVSAALPEAEVLRPVVTTVAGADRRTWLAAIETQLQTRDDRSLVRQRQAVARRDSWDAMAERAEAEIDRLLGWPAPGDGVGQSVRG